MEEFSFNPFLLCVKTTLVIIQNKHWKENCCTFSISPTLDRHNIVLINAPHLFSIFHFPQQIKLLPLIRAIGLTSPSTILKTIFNWNLNKKKVVWEVGGGGGWEWKRTNWIIWIEKKNNKENEGQFPGEQKKDEYSIFFGRKSLSCQKQLFFPAKGARIPLRKIVYWLKKQSILFNSIEIYPFNWEILGKMENVLIEYSFGIVFVMNNYLV